MRGKIRQAIVDRLTAAFSATVSIYNSRYAAIKSLPAVVVYTSGDNAEKSADEQAYTRRESVSIHVYASGFESHEEPTEEIMDKLEALVEVVEAEFMNPYETLSGLIYRLNYQSTELQIRDDGSKVYGFGVLEFEAVYFDEMDKNET